MARIFAPRLLALGDAAWTVELGDGIAPQTHTRVLGLLDQIRQQGHDDPLLKGVVDVVPAFRSLTVHYDPWHTDATALGRRLLALAMQQHPRTSVGRHWRLPVCFDETFAPDLQRVAEALDLSTDTVIEQLLATRLQVYMIGFQPGFPYMGGLPDALVTPRLATPRQKVPAQSVAIAGSMCGVYPWESPGGWNLLGRTPVRLFDPQGDEQPAMLGAGDTVQWVRVNRDGFDQFTQAIEQGLPRAHFLVGTNP